MKGPRAEPFYHLSAERDRLQSQFYAEFLKEHKELFERNPSEYWVEASRYAERRMAEEIAKRS